MPLATYRAQRRGGKGRSGMSTREEDVVTQLFVASTHTPGAVLLLARHVLPHEGLAPAGGDPASRRARRWSTCCRSTEGEAITSILPLPEDRDDLGRRCELMFATRSGNVRRNALSDFENINRNGKIAMKLDDGDRIVAGQHLPRPATTCC